MSNIEKALRALAGYRAEGDLYKALAHPVRLQILDLLARQEACVCHLTAAIGQRQPYVSQQLAALRDAGLVVDRRDGNLVYYRLRDPKLVALLSVGRLLATGDRPDLLAAYPGPDEGPESDCPCPRCVERTPKHLVVVSTD